MSRILLIIFMVGMGFSNQSGAISANETLRLITVQSNYQSEHFKNVEKDYQEIKKFQQDQKRMYSGSSDDEKGFWDYFWGVLIIAVAGFFIVGWFIDQLENGKRDRREKLAKQSLPYLNAININNADISEHSVSWGSVTVGDSIYFKDRFLVKIDKTTAVDNQLNYKSFSEDEKVKIGVYNKNKKSTAKSTATKPVAVKSSNKVIDIKNIEADISSMTVSEISSITGKSERGVRTYLTRHGIAAKDYDGASKQSRTS